MPFWSKKGKERASSQDIEPLHGITWIRDDRTGELIRQDGYRLPQDQVAAFEERWEEEMHRRIKVSSMIAGEGAKRCWPGSLAAEEAYTEAIHMYYEADSVNWTRQEAMRYDPDSWTISAYVKQKTGDDCARKHVKCCRRKAGIDERVAWAIRNLRSWDGKQPLEEIKAEGLPRPSSTENEELAPPSYSEAAAPAYSDSVDV